MASLADRILDFLGRTDGRTDREVTDALLGRAADQQRVNAACRQLEARGLILRRTRSEGLIGNFLVRTTTATGRPAGDTQAAGDSPEQRAAEHELIQELSKSLGVKLEKRTIPLPEGGRLELDGMAEHPPIICEAWAHIGPAKGAQKYKVMTDAFKLIFASQFLPAGTRKVLVTADRKAVQHLQGKAWMAQALRANNVELHAVHVRPETVEALLAAQKRQFR